MAQPSYMGMERLFPSTFTDFPGIHIGSRTMELFENKSLEQAYENVHLAYGKPGDAVVLRNADPAYLAYWHRLIPGVYVYNHSDAQGQDYLSDVILRDKEFLAWLRAHGKRLIDMSTRQPQIFVFFPTNKEAQLAELIELPLYGSPPFSARYGTKSGCWNLAQKYDLAIPPSIVCNTLPEISDAIHRIFADAHWNQVVIKHDLSIGGDWSIHIKRHEAAKQRRMAKLLQKLTEHVFEKGISTTVVQAWIDNAIATLSAHIEIPAGDEVPQVRWGWEQLTERGIAYLGAKPLMLQNSTFHDFWAKAEKLANIFKAEGALGTYGPNFIITPDNEILLLEINARIPLSAFGFSIIQQLKGSIGDGFVIKYVHVPPGTTFRDVQGVLLEAGILIQEARGIATQGVVPFNVGLLPYGKCNMVAIAPDYDEAAALMRRAERLLRG